MQRYKRIFIIGHCGAGKGLLAKALSDKLGWKHIDADFALGPSVGWPLNEILGDDGQASFYHCLSEILTHQMNLDNVIVTTDDSIVCSPKNREMLTHELTVYLNVSTPVQIERISHNRPLISSEGYEDFLHKLHVERDDLYKEVASITLQSDDNDLDGHVKAVVEYLEKSSF